MGSGSVAKFWVVRSEACGKVMLEASWEESRGSIGVVAGGVGDEADCWGCWAWGCC